MYRGVAPSFCGGVNGRVGGDQQLRTFAMSVLAASVQRRRTIGAEQVDGRVGDNEELHPFDGVPPAQLPTYVMKDGVPDFIERVELANLVAHGVRHRDQARQEDDVDQRIDHAGELRSVQNASEHVGGSWGGAARARPIREPRGALP